MEDEKSLEVAAFRVWSQNSEVGRVEREIVGSTWNSSIERGTTIFERFRWVSTKFDAESGTVLTRWRSVWADRSGAKKAFANRPSELEVRTLLWKDLHAPALLDQNDARTLRLRARAIWDDVVAVFHDRLLQGDIRAYGRAGSMTDPRVSEIPAAAWHHFTIDDWGKRTAKSDDGHRLFDLHIAPHEPSPQPVPVVKKPDLAKNAIKRAFPDGVPPSLPVEAIIFEAAKFWPPGIGPLSETTVRRALGRKK
jgi:hypothetical protein